jgi:prevent-host-death family protein
MSSKRAREASYNVAETKQRLSDLLGRVAYGKESIVITRRGKPMARLVPISEGPPAHLGDAAGWLDGDDPFFTDLEEIIARRKEGKERKHRLGD